MVWKIVRETWRDPMGNYDNLTQERVMLLGLERVRAMCLVHGWTVNAFSINSVNVFVYSLVPLFITQLKVTLPSRINCIFCIRHS